MANMNQVVIRMYRMGTGDFFLLTFSKAGKNPYRIMIDCGCINVAGDTVEAHVKDLLTHLGNRKVIDLLIVTHEHADHINGFEKGSELFDKIEFKKVWFAWTESKNDPIANDYRGFSFRAKSALQKAALKINEIVKDPEFKTRITADYRGALALSAFESYAESLDEFSKLNLPYDENGVPTMEDKLIDYKVIKPHTEVEFVYPNKILEHIDDLPGVRFFVLGPPAESKYLNVEERKGETYEKRETPSAFNFAFIDALASGEEQRMRPFKAKYEDTTTIAKELYDKEPWRKIDHDWLNSVSTLALRYERSINNTSLALAIQFIDGGKVLLFPGDAEFGSWLSWHEKLSFEVLNEDNKKVTLRIEDLFNDTVFYKVSHHLSQNGTPAAKGIDLLTNSNLCAFATLDLSQKKIQKVWRNTMPNDFIGSALVNKTKGKLFFVGDAEQILKNIQTDRVSVDAGHVKKAKTLNKKFDGKMFIEYKVKA